MYKKIIVSFVGFIWLFVIGGCANKDLDCDCDDDTVEIRFSLSTPIGESRSLGTIEPKESANRIENFQIFIFDADGFLEKSIYTDQTNIDRIIKANVSIGTKDFFAVANVGKELTNISNKHDFTSQISTIENQQHSPFLMVAQRFGEEVTRGKNLQVFTLTVERLVARIRLQYETDFRNTYYENKVFALDSVYIMNGNTRCTYSFMEERAGIQPFVFKSGRKGGDDFLGCFLETGYWTSTPVGFYSNKYFSFAVFPNTNEKAPTKIVLSGLLDGMRTYYPITVNQIGGKVDWGDTAPHHYLHRNTDYKIRVTITGDGSEEPDIDIEYVNVSLGVSCVDWSESWQDDDFKE